MRPSRSSRAPSATRPLLDAPLAFVDYQPRLIASLDDGDQRTATMNVAGPGALLVVKLHKIAERRAEAESIRRPIRSRRK